jgi:hypothetical protein
MAGRRDGTLKMERKDIGAAIACPGRLRSLKLDQGLWTMFRSSNRIHAPKESQLREDTCTFRGPAGINRQAAG